MLSHAFLRLVRSQSGNVLPMAAMGVLVSAALVGGGVDMSRAYQAKTRLQAACDAGVLAGRRAINTAGFDAAALQAANSYFDANFDDSGPNIENTVFVPTSPDNGNSVRGTVTSEINTLIMKIFGFQRFDLTVNCTASMGVGNSDVMMVLDTTGSMSAEADGTAPESGETSKLQDLQAAMKNFYDTVATASQGTNSRIRYGFVPYSSSVNVGKLIYDENPNYLVDSYAIQSRRWFVWEDVPEETTGTTTSAPYYDRNWTRIDLPAYNNEAACIAAKPADGNWANSGSPGAGGSTTEYINDQGQRVVRRLTSTQQQSRRVNTCRLRSGKWYVNYRNAYQDISNYEYEISDPVYNVSSPTADVDGLMYGQFQYDVSGFKQGNTVSLLIGEDNDAPVWVTSKWDGCIEERRTVSEDTFSYVSGTGITPLGATDLDIDSAPTGDDATKWAPMWPQLAFYRTAGVEFGLSGTAASSNCPVKAQLLTEMDEDDFDAYADSLAARGNTYHDIGILWGARLSSPEGVWSDNVNEDPSNSGAVSRHLIFMTDGELMPSTTMQSSYGIERNDWRITDNGSTNQSARHRSRFLALCEAVKGKGIRLWVIAFGTALSTDLRTCASANSSYTAASSSALNTAFQEIAKQVGELRVTL